MGRLRPRFKSHEPSRPKRSPADLYDAGLRHFLSKRDGPAEDRCRQALALDPTHADSLHLLGLVHWQTRRLDLAVELIASAIRCNPNNHDYFLNLGELLREQNKLDEARKSFDIAIRLAPDRAASWIKLGNLLRLQRRTDEALLSYEHAFTLDPGNAEASALSAGLLLELGRYQEALAKCELSLAISADQAEALCVKGDCLHNLGRTAEAAASYRRASELEPERVSVWRLLGKVLEQLGDRDGAIKALRRARELDPADPFGAGVELMRLGADEVSEMPAAYVRLLFDRYAPTFDSALVESLGYRGPRCCWRPCGRHAQRIKSPRNSNTRSISVAVPDWRRPLLPKWSIASPASTFRRRWSTRRAPRVCMPSLKWPTCWRACGRCRTAAQSSCWPPTRWSMSPISFRS